LQNILFQGLINIKPMISTEVRVSVDNPKTLNFKDQSKPTKRGLQREELTNYNVVCKAFSAETSRLTLTLDRDWVGVTG